jgi:hypothetical protein
MIRLLRLTESFLMIAGAKWRREKAAGKPTVPSICRPERGDASLLSRRGGDDAGCAG